MGERAKTLLTPRQITKGVPSEEWGVRRRQFYDNGKVCQARRAARGSVLNEQISVGGNTSPPPTSAIPRGGLCKFTRYDHRPEADRRSPGNLGGTV